MQWWYFSFVGENGWLGACVVQAADEIEAIRESHRQKCNPGGEVLIVPVPPERRGDFDEDFPPERRNKLLSLIDIPDPHLVYRDGQVVD